MKNSVAYSGSSSKFYHKSLTLLVPIIELLSQGIYPIQIARKLNIKKPHLYYYISKARAIGLLNFKSNANANPYDLTQAGIKFLDRYQKYQPKNSVGDPILMCRAENIRFKADVLRKPSNLVDWDHVQMNNWNLHTFKMGNVRIKLNEGRRPTVEFLPSPVDGNEALELIVDLVQECQIAAFRLEERTGLKIGRLRLEPRGEWLVYSPIARWFSQTYGQVTVRGIGKVNASKPRAIGEFEFQDVRDLVDHMLVPRRVERIEKMVEGISGIQKKFGAANRISLSISNTDHSTNPNDLHFKNDMETKTGI